MSREVGMHLFVCGSPRRHGRSAALVGRLVEVEDSARAIYVSDVDIAGCTGCDACRAYAPRICCIQRDDMQKVYELLAAAQRLTMVVPLYFAGPPSQMKALLDRLQPHYWANTRSAPKRPARLFVVGEGGDPHGADALITIVRSALAVAGYSLDEIEVQVGDHA